METIENNGSEQPELKTAHQKGGAKAAAIFWARFPTPEARSQYMKERFAKVKAKRAKKAAAQAHGQEKPREQCDEEQAADAIYELRLLLGDVLAMLEACNNGGKAGEARDIMGRQVSRECLMAATSILQRGIRKLDIAGVD